MDKSPHFGHSIKQLSNAFEQAANRTLAVQKLTTAQSFFLGFIYRNEIQGMHVHSKDLANYFNLRHSTVSGILQRLEGGGFIKFVPDETDHRLKRIVLTKKAHNAHLRTIREFDALEQKMLDGFTEYEAQLFYQFLLRAASNIGTDCEPEIKKGE